MNAHISVLEVLKPDSMQDAATIAETTGLRLNKVNRILNEMVDKGQVNLLKCRDLTTKKLVRRYSRHLADHETFCDLHVWSCDINPRVERIIRVSHMSTYLDLHNVIQAAFDFDDEHEFEYLYYPRNSNKSEVTVDDFDNRFVDGLRRSHDKSLIYIYDLGDYWVFKINMVAIGSKIDGIVVPDLLDGKRVGPPEDCGGPMDYEYIMKAIKNDRNTEGYHKGGYREHLIQTVSADFNLENAKSEFISRIHNDTTEANLTV